MALPEGSQLIQLTAEAITPLLQGEAAVVKGSPYTFYSSRHHTTDKMLRSD